MVKFITIIMTMKKTLIFITSLIISLVSLSAQPFNEKLTDEDKAVLQTGEVLIKNIKFDSHMSLNGDFSPLAQKLCEEFQ